MPLWQVFSPEGTYTDEDKEALSASITTMYTDFVNLPKFYVVVIFNDLPQNSIYIGGKANNNFVRIFIDHIARRVEGDDLQAVAMQLIEAKIAPWVRDRGHDWEVHVDETPPKLWRTQGLVPPPAGSDGEHLWARENRAVPYELATV